MPKTRSKTDSLRSSQTLAPPPSPQREPIPLSGDFASFGRDFLDEVISYLKNDVRTMFRIVRLNKAFCDLYLLELRSRMTQDELIVYTPALWNRSNWIAVKKLCVTYFKMFGIDIQVANARFGMNFYLSGLKGIKMTFDYSHHSSKKKSYIVWNEALFGPAPNTQVLKVTLPQVQKTDSNNARKEKKRAKNKAWKEAKRKIAKLAISAESK